MTQVQKAGAIAALSVGAVSSSLALGATVTPILLPGDQVGEQVFYGNVWQVALGDNGNFAVIADLADTAAGINQRTAAVFGQPSGATYNPSLITYRNPALPDSAGYGHLAEIENLSIASVGGQSHITFSSLGGGNNKPNALYGSVNGSTPVPLFYGDSGGETMVTSSSVYNPIGYGISHAGHLAYGTAAGTNQFLYVGSSTTPGAVKANTGTLSQFNWEESGDQSYAAKRLPVSANSAVAIAHDGNDWGVFQFNSPSSAAAPSTFVNSPAGFTPRRLLGATAQHVYFFAESSTAAGRLFYGDPTDKSTVGVVPTDISTVSASTAAYGLSSQVSAGGKLAAFSDDTGLIYFDPNQTSGGPLASFSGSSFANVDFVRYGHGPASMPGFVEPMVNDNGWVVFEAIVLDDADQETAAILAWNPLLNSLQIVAQLGDAVGDTGFTIAEFSRNPQFEEFDVLRDGLNELNQVALHVVMSDDESSSAIVLANITVPEPAMLGMVGIGAGGTLLSRRRRPQSR